ncbi:MAG TPA: hypothetical protein VG295_07015 [Solirubrobacteraceae bacterium]|nr:hypothetical protein [Solirubrobacteraceae bacterium]
MSSSAGTGTREGPWIPDTRSGASEHRMHRDELERASRSNRMRAI